MSRKSLGKRPDFSQRYTSHDSEASTLRNEEDEGESNLDLHNLDLNGRNKNNNNNNNDNTTTSSGPQNQESAKDKTTPEKRLVHLVIKSNTGHSDVMYRVNAEKPLVKMLAAYSRSTARKADTIRFLFESARVLPTTTPDELEMQDGDSIYAMTEQIGGS